ncbi:HEAT repeat-containing protein [Actinidia rufa]|uniref:HEAT repeat-containing protein n=1 Tax=Actinidia rufa TaxID=165716 RepID=A0A7J0E7T6_9ERIC|nr:HEAT repeat-containing protein [Actinidia rufa]
MEGDEIRVVGTQYENGLFSSSLSELFSRKLRLTSNSALYGHSVGDAASHYEEEEPFEYLEEMEVQTIGNLLPNDDELLSGVTDGIDYVGQSNSTRNAMRALQDKPLRWRKLDIHFSIPKDNPFEKDIDLDSSVSNEISEAPQRSHGKFIEFYDVMAAEAALRALNTSDIAGKKIKIEPSRPGACCHHFLQIVNKMNVVHTYSKVTHQVTQQQDLLFLMGESHFASMDNGTIPGVHSAIRFPGSPFLENVFRRGIMRVESLGNQSSLPDCGHSKGQLKVEFQGSPNFHPHSFPEYHDGYTNGFNSLDMAVNVNARPSDRIEYQQLCRLYESRDLGLGSGPESAMVGIMAANAREKVASLVNLAKFAMDIPSKLELLRPLKDELSLADSVLLADFLPLVIDLHTDRFSPGIGIIRIKCKVEEAALIPPIALLFWYYTCGLEDWQLAPSTVSMLLIGDIGLKNVECIPEIVPVLMTLLKDRTPAVARQAISCGIDLFRSCLIKVAIQPGSDGTRLPAVKFVEAVILLYTLDPSGSLEPPLHQVSEEKSVEFNISWIRGGHPVLNVGDLSIEASQSLGVLLDELRLPTVKSLSNSMIIVLITSLSAIAKKRPAFYGRILPVLLSLDPSGPVNKGVRVSGAHHALRKAFLSCLQCTHTGAAPWRDRLVSALSEMKGEGLVEQTLHQVCQINGSVDRKDDIPITQEEKSSSVEGCDAVHSNSGRKRSGLEDPSDMADDDVSGKRLRSTPTVSEGSEQDLSRDKVGIPSSGQASSRGDGDNGPVQQLVAMFGALVAQGEKAIGSLEILISSISADLLAEVVMTNMRHLPPNCPKAEGDEEPSLNRGSSPNVVGCDAQFKHLSSILTQLLSVSSAPTQMNILLDAQWSSSNDIENPQGDKELAVMAVSDNDVVCTVVRYESEQALVPVPVCSSDEVQSATETGVSALPSGVLDVGNLESGIPGLDSVTHSDRLAETLTGPSLTPIDLEDASQEQVSSLSKSPLDLVPSLSTDRSEELSPKAAITDASSINSSTATSVGLSAQFVLPKMSAPVIDLADEEKDTLQKLAFTRVVEAYKQIAIAGGSHVRFSLLAYLGMESPLELDPWKILKEHIFADYTNHEGHEFTLRVLFRLFGEAEEERDFFSSTTATSVYEMFILNVAETLRDSFPASDKSLSRLLGEAPYLPKSIFKLLESLCSPGSNDKDDKELHSGDRVTQGLSTIWNLILWRPPIRDVCLKIALQVANKLYPLSSIAQQIEDFAKEMVHSVSNGDHAMDKIDGEGSELQKDANFDKPSTQLLSLGAMAKNISLDTSQSCISQNISSSSLTEAQRCMSLYFALCTKKHSLFREIFTVYKSTSNIVKQAVHGQIPILVRTIGPSAELLEIISDPPTGSENLLIQVLHTLTDGTVPSPELVLTIRKLYDTKLKDVEILIPILSYLPKDEVLLIFPHLVNLPLDKFQAALARVLQVTDACNACFEQRQIFTQQVLAKVLNQLVEQIPLPLLFMRTVLQAIGAFPALIWKHPKLWVGFLKCALLTKPQSFSVLLQLPPAQLENALNRTAALKTPLIAHANQPNIRSSLPRSVLAVLGIASESQNSNQAQPTPAHTGETGNSDKEAVTENPKNHLVPTNSI